MRVTFEEKTYENYFNIELARRTEMFFPPGQVQEGNLGFDASALSYNHRLWKILGHPFRSFPPFVGLELQEIAEKMEYYFGKVISGIPKMKANLIFQYKKPVFITKSQGTEWSFWNQPYFRYDIYREQQDILMHIHNSFGSRVLTLYAAPAICDVNELVTLYSQNNLIYNSNFKKAVELNSHYRNTYIRAGTYSIGCSETKRIKDFDLINELNNYNNDDKRNYGEENNSQFIINFRKKIENIVDENRYYANSFKLLNTVLEGLIEYQLFYSFLVMVNFRQLTGTQWLIKV